jgi:uroporphyrinogen decarboxylase
MSGTMTPRERILAVLNREPVDRLPVDLWHTPEVGEVLRQHCGVADDLAMYRALNLDKIVWVFMDYQTAAGDRAGGQSGAGAEGGGDRTMWGVPLKQIQAGAARYAEFGSAPLAGYNDCGIACRLSMVAQGGALRLRIRGGQGARGGTALCRDRAVGLAF